jgi:hypothetical protein
MIILNFLVRTTTVSATMRAFRSGKVIERVNNPVGVALAAVLGLIGTACQSVATPAASAAGPEPVASVQELMQDEVDGAADQLWAAVSYSADLSGPVEHQPRSDADWRTLRQAAIVLVEATNLLAMPGRQIAAAGAPLSDAAAPGMLSAQQIQASIERNRPTFGAYARALQTVGLEALGAIDQRSVARLQEAGGRIDEACEACHLVFWYPAPEPR